MKKFKTFSLALSLLICFVTMAQNSNVNEQKNQRTITGTVSDKNEALPFVSIQIKGKQKGTQTDLDGKFSITINKNDVLIFSYVGYETYELEIGEKISKYYIQLKSNAHTLEETYGYEIPRKKKNQLQEPKKIRIEELNKTIVEEDTKTLKGKIPRINIPIENNKRNVVGRSSTRTSNFAEPLYVIDGIISTKKKITKMNTDNIASIEVLKDSTATAIYGKQGVNGVILITTKKLSKKELKKLKKYTPKKTTDSL